ncbi:MAG: 7-cyano-7-deazaguanine synthase [Patescibacteria group bacterium]
MKNMGAIKFKDKINENMSVIKLINKIFKDKRGYIVKMPPKGSSVVCCMSGGADAVSNIFILMNEFGYEVYPFFINRGQSSYKWEKTSVGFYDKLFKNKFPKLYNKTKEISVNTPAKEYKNDLRNVKKKCYEKEHSAHISYPARNSIIFLTGMEYAISLQNKGKKINTVFIAHVASDTSFHCSLTWQRILNLETCHILNDYNFQYISLPIEVEFGNFYDKEVLIMYCEKNGLDLSKTRTCIKSSKIQCGVCPCCWDRRRCYLLAEVEDKTKYLKPYPKKSGGYY